MPACNIHLLALRVPLPQFLQALLPLKPLLTSRVIRWIITPQTIHSDLPNQAWDLLVILPSTAALPTSLLALTRTSFSLTAGIPSRLVGSFSTHNRTLLHPPAGSVPALTGALAGQPIVADSAQRLMLSSELRSWVEGPGKAAVPGAVSMLNLLAFKDGMKASYLQYGRAFAESIGAARGGEAKIVGTVLDGEEGRRSWDEVAVAHYPSIEHFADMIASRDYQEVNLKFRVPALKDTLILCTNELDLPWPEGSKL